MVLQKSVEWREKERGKITHRGSGEPLLFCTRIGDLEDQKKTGRNLLK